MSGYVVALALAVGYPKVKVNCASQCRVVIACALEEAVDICRFSRVVDEYKAEGEKPKVKSRRSDEC